MDKNVSSKALWAGRIIAGLTILFFVFDVTVKVLRLPEAVEPTVRLGYPASLIFNIGIIELVCTLLYVIPQTSVLGAILLTGYLGGATAPHVRIGEPFYFPLAMGAMVWGGIYLRESRLHALVPFRRP